MQIVPPRPCTLVLPSIGKYLFEKLLSGLYLGEVARRILLNLAKDRNVALFGRGSGAIPAKLEVPWKGWESEDVARAASDASEDLAGVEAAVVKALGVKLPSLEARRVVREGDGGEGGEGGRDTCGVALQVTRLG